jgi:hypothetical protein
MGLNEPDGGGEVIVANGIRQRPGDVVDFDPLLELRPMRQPVFACDDELCVAQAKRAGRDLRVVGFLEPGMTAPDSVERATVGATPEIEELARLTLRNVEMGTIGQLPGYGAHNLSSRVCPWSARLGRESGWIFRTINRWAWPISTDWLLPASAGNDEPIAAGNQAPLG